MTGEYDYKDYDIKLWSGQHDGMVYLGQSGKPQPEIRVPNAPTQTGPVAMTNEGTVPLLALSVYELWRVRRENARLVVTYRYARTDS